jgi:general secretion pathway protein D
MSDDMIHAKRIFAAAALFALGACSWLPPSLRPAQAPVEKPLPESAQRVAVQAAARDQAAKDAPAGGAAEAMRVYPGQGVVVRNPIEKAEPPKPAEEASLNFEAADVREVAKVILADYLKESYTIHPAVTGTVTFRTVRPIAMKDLLPTLEMLLRQNNAAVVKEDGLYKVLPISAVRGSISPTLGSPYMAAIPPGFSVVVVPLKFVGAKDMERLLQPFASDNTVRIDEARNLVILAGNQREIRHLIDTIEMFDVDFLAGYSVGVFPIKSADVKALVQDLDKVFGPNAPSPLAGAVRVIPLERMNALLIVTVNPKYLDMAATWITRLDHLGGTSGGSRLFVYQVRNGKAENLAQLVGDLFASRRSSTTAPSLAPGQRPTEIRSAPFGQTQPTPQTTTTTVTPAAGAATFSLPGGVGTTQNEVRVIADKDTNALLIVATPGDYEVIEQALKKLDVIRRQVLVEVMLAEVKLTDELKFGIDWFLKTRNNTSGTLNTLGALPSTPTGTVAPFTGGLQLVQMAGNEIRAVLQTFGTDGRAKVLAAPQIMVLDNEKAEIKVGDRISVQTQAQTGVSTGTGVLNSFQYLETGILLAVTPRINSGGLVTLEVNQEVSAPSSTPTVINPNPDISTRSAKTSVVVASGESIAPAGLIREVVTYDSTGIPLLSKIPLIGAAFGTQSFNRERTELVLVITPKIISDPAQAREATQELKERLPSLRGLLPHLETHGDAGSTSPPAEMTVPTQSAAPFIAAPPAPAPAAPAPASPTGATPGTPLSNPTPPPK